MKKLLFVFVITGLLFSCSSDDDAQNDPMVGTWKAETVSYTFGDVTHTYDYNVEGGPFAGCEVDFLTLNNGGAAKLVEHIKNENDECNTLESNGTWTKNVVNIRGGDREVDYYDDESLVLSYPIVYYGQTLPITVEYSKQ